jgi:hypothetical protein
VRTRPEPRPPRPPLQPQRGPRQLLQQRPRQTRTRPVATSRCHRRPRQGAARPRPPQRRPARRPWWNRAGWLHSFRNCSITSRAWSSPTISPSSTPPAQTQPPPRPPGKEWEVLIFAVLGPGPRGWVPAERLRWVALPGGEGDCEAADDTAPPHPAPGLAAPRIGSGRGGGRS